LNKIQNNIVLFSPFLEQMTDKINNDPSGTLGSINGLPVSSSNSVPSNLAKGTGTALSAVVIGHH